MSPLRIEFDTVRDLEKKSFRVFAYSGGALLAGFVLMVMALPIVGIPLMALSAVAILLAIGWVYMLGKEQSRPLFCPYCSSKNDVYISRRQFVCDICGRPVVVSDSGEALVAEAIDTEARYDRRPSQ